MSDQIQNFISELSKSLADDTFVKLTLSNYKGAEEHLQKLGVRIIETKQGRRLSFQKRYETRETVKNFGFDEGAEVIREILGSGFRNVHLFTTQADFQLTIGKKSSRLVSGRPSIAKQPSMSHDREKQSIVDQRAYYLQALGIAGDDGNIRKSQFDKWRQINKYVEVLRDFYERSSLKEKTNLKVVDMGSGKGYLTFAAYDYFANVRGLKVEMTGVDTKQELIDLCNQIANSAGYEGLKFVNGTIESFDAGKVDVLIALHACDTATDDALFKGITAGTELIVAAPCCHKEVRRQISAPEFLKGVLKHGVMSERTAETITDGLRALLLEENGYRTKVFEFISSEHTPKNNMIVGVRDNGRDNKSEFTKQIDELLGAFSISHQRLHSLLNRK